MATNFETRVRTKTLIAEHNVKLEQRKEIISLSLKDMLTEKSARRVLKHVLEQTNLFDYNFTGDPIRDAYLNGQRSIGLMLRELLTKEQLRKIEDEEI